MTTPFSLSIAQTYNTGAFWATHNSVPAFGWTGLAGDGNWNTAGNWGTSVVPGAGDVAKFHGAYCIAAACNATVNVSISIAGIDIDGAYGGTITQASGKTIAVGASGWSQAGGTFAGSDADINQGGVFTLSGGTFTSTKSGNWSDPTLWNAGSVPGPGDNAIIANGHTVTIDGNNLISDLTVGQGTSGILYVGNDATARNFTVIGNLTIANGAVFKPNPGFAARHYVSLQGNVANASVFDMSPGGSSYSEVTFSKNGNQTFSGAGATTRFDTLILNLGSSVSNTVEFTCSNFSAPSNFLVMKNGTFKFSVPSSVKLE